jgi:hypothetical protein
MLRAEKEAGGYGQVLSKYRYLPTKLHGITSQKTIGFKSTDFISQHQHIILKVYSPNIGLYHGNIS